MNNKPDTQPKNFALTPLHDGRLGLRRGFHAGVREPIPSPDGQSGPDGERQGESERSSHLTPDTRHSPTQDSVPASSPDTRHSSPILDFIASSEALDRYNEIISADGWRLDNYRRNPVFQNAHQYGDIIFTLGKALITEVRNGKLFQRVEFATEINPMAKIAYGLYKGKFLNAVSVGFIPLKWEDAPPSASASASGSASIPRRRYLQQELLEVSAVGIPANPEALQLGLKAGAIERADVRALLDLVRLAYESQKSAPGRGNQITASSPLPSPPEEERAPRGPDSGRGHESGGSGSPPHPESGG